MAILGTQLKLGRCPHCGIANPTMRKGGDYHKTATFEGTKVGVWATYICTTCGKMVIALAPGQNTPIIEMYPKEKAVDEEIQGRAKEYLQQAMQSGHAPAGAIMLAASAIDAMLKEKDYKDGSLYGRIDQAAKDHVITDSMAQWAHEVRLDANEQRHSDEAAPLPTPDDGRRCVEFALALAQFLFVLPARVERGIADATS